MSKMNNTTINAKPEPLYPDMQLHLPVLCTNILSRNGKNEMDKHPRNEKCFFVSIGIKGRKTGRDKTFLVNFVLTAECGIR